jgi:DNA polymerase-3 subunit delta'
LLVQGSDGIGALAFTLSLAQSWLCERAVSGSIPSTVQPACGRCTGCRLVGNHLHPDLFVLLPETLRRQHAWPLRDEKAESEDSKRKPSKQVRIDEVRALIDWTTRTSARGRGKVAVLHPAESLNLQSANALLKTLEEPPQGTRLLLCSADPGRLLPTLRSRCQLFPLATPDEAVATAPGDRVATVERPASPGEGGDERLLHRLLRRPADAVGLLAEVATGDEHRLLRGRAAGGCGCLCHRTTSRSCRRRTPRGRWIRRFAGNYTPLYGFDSPSPRSSRHDFQTSIATRVAPVRVRPRGGGCGHRG